MALLVMREASGILLTGGHLCEECKDLIKTLLSMTQYVVPIRNSSLINRKYHV